MPHPVADHPLRARLAGQPAVIGQLQPFLTVIIDIGEAQHMRRHFAGRIITAIFALTIDARDPQRQNLLRAFRLHLSAQIEEFFVRMRLQALTQIAQPHTQQRSQRGQPLRTRQYLARYRPDRHYRRRNRQWLAVAIENRATRYRDRHHPDETGVTLSLIKIFVDNLQIDGAQH
ncbi:hypothetical protein RF55_22200 [Lasius niger]|uniref:Uncharacterized protein n=1 Tax=Lasius niger TaxID=67767 RepID=A0A0J7JX62_LASNI|nr:hypothetical protein RF55_22200 [Lasius niger]